MAGPGGLGRLVEPHQPDRLVLAHALEQVGDPGGWAGPAATALESSTGLLVNARTWLMVWPKTRAKVSDGRE